ncbi:MAG: CRISPR-associated helicase Cas3', partial [Candidatus Aenigmatarchaeota archaeon]
NGFRDIDIENHEIISLIYSLIFLDNSDWDKKIRTAILFHHYNEFYSNRSNINFRSILDDYPDLDKYLEFLIKKEDEIKKILENFIEEISSVNINVKKIMEGLQKRLKETNSFDKIKKLKNNIEKGYNVSTVLKLFDVSNKDDKDKDFYDFFVFIGCLRRCDYAASGNVEIEQPKNLAQDIYHDLLHNIKKSFGKSAEEIWQEKILKKYDAKKLILIAPTGSGKTEFAILWAKNRNKKLIYTLPLRVALNDLYWRFSEGKKYFDEDDVGILHSTSFIEYLKECKEGDEISIGEMINSSKLFSTPILLTTPDQVFLSSLKYYGFDKLISVYPLSAIVIDEIQAYNPEMAAIIIKTLEIVQQLKGDILIITATFPPYFEEFFSDFNKISLEELIQANHIRQEEVKNYAIKRHKIEVMTGGIFEYKDNEMVIVEGGLNNIKDIIDQNGDKNIMIVLNNVGKAIQLFEKLKEIYKEKNEKNQLFLLHSRLIEKVKASRIDEIKKKLNNREKGLILVATQIVEASIDVDFDILITEVSPIESQIQRWGRVWRNRNMDYRDEKPNIYVFTNIDRGTKAIYDEKVISSTVEILKEYEGIVLDYKEEKDLIKRVYEEKIKILGYGNYEIKILDYYKNKIKENLEWLKYFSAEKINDAHRIFRRIAGIQVVVPPLMENSDDEIEKAFYEIIKDKNNWNLPWEDIVDKVKQKVRDEKLKNKVTKWTLLKILYMYSFNLPIFSFGINYQFQHQILEKDSLKGFFVLKKEAIDINRVRDYGLDKIKNIDIDNEEINQAESFDNVV